MDAINYTSIGPVLYLNKAGELTQKRMKAVKFCDGLYVTEPDKAHFVNLIVEYDGIKWIESQAPAAKVDPANMAKRMPAILASIKDGRLNEFNDYHKELHRRIFNPDAPAIMELKKPERKKPCQSPDGTIRAKVLQYKSDGNTLTEKWHTLAKFTEGIYLSYANPDKYGQVYVTVVFAKNGIFWKAGCELERYFRPESFRHAEHMETLKRRYADYEANIMQAVANGGWINKLHITVMERLGHDVADLQAAREKYIRQREERERQEAEEAARKDRERQEAEEAARKDRERQEAEERRKAEALADGKEKLLNGEYISVEQIELIAEAVGYKINIRTLGFMREKVSEAVLCKNDTVHVWGRKLTSRNIDGTANVMRELYARLKAQAEEEAERAATPAETPKISTVTAKTTNDTTRVYKPRETVRKLPKSAIRDFRTTHARKKLGVQGYSMLADASATLAAINVPPIRGDCTFADRAMDKPYR